MLTRVLIAALVFLQMDTLQVKVSLVTVGVRVTDSRGRSVTGLKTENFSIVDEGIPQKIEFFSNQEQPIALGILLDRSFSMSYNAKLRRATEAARTLIRASHRDSEYFYVVFDDQVTVAADFTSNREEVEAAIEKTTLGGGTSLYDALIEGLTLSRRAQLPRQAMVVISDGADQHSRHDLKETMSLIRESEMQIFTIGYFAPEEDEVFRSSGATVQLLGGQRIDNPRDVLQRIARESGAEAFFPRSDAELVRAIQTITEDLRTQYTLAFYPQPEDSEGKYHRLRVAVRGGRYNVRARPGYGGAEMPQLR
jgi:Ca-activated chloride channel family protein